MALHHKDIFLPTIIQSERMELLCQRVHPSADGAGYLPAVCQSDDLQGPPDSTDVTGRVDPEAVQGVLQPDGR